MDSQTGPQDESEQAATPRTFDAQILDALLSEQFSQLLNEIPKGDERRARALFKAGGQFHLHYETSKSVSSLDHAIAFTAEALEEIPKPHDELKTYATIYAHLLRLKTEKTGKLEDCDRYISGLEKRIEFVGEGDLKEEAVRELGCAYFVRFGQGNDFKDLRQAIAILQESRQRVDLLQKGLQCVPQDKVGIAFLRDFGLGMLVSACAMLNIEQPGGEILERLISNVEVTLAFFPPGTAGISQLNKQHIHALMRRYFKGPESVQEIIDTIEGNLDEELTESQNAPPIADTEWPEKSAKSLMQQPLSDDRRNIRLIELLPGPKEDPIKCKLIEEKLDGARSYEANLKEKQHQITLMREIYKRATTVIMWLGEPKGLDSPLEAKTETDKKPPERRIASNCRGPTPSGVGQKRQPIPGLTDGDVIQLMLLVGEKLQWLQSVLFGCQAATMITSDGIPGFLDIADKVVKDVDQQQQIEVLFQNIRIRHLLGTQLDTFDWTSIENIPAFFNAPQTRSMWPFLGAFSLIYAFAHMSHFHELPFFDKGDDLAYQSSQTWIKSAAALDNLLSSSYWDRAWILQEIVLARRPILYYGPHVIPFDHLVQAQKYFEFHYEHCCAKWGNNSYRKKHTYWTKIMDGFRKFGAFERLREAHTSSGPSGGGNPSLSLFNLMRTGVAKRKASDPRDLVYGILGLVDSKEKIEPDYTLSVARVFARAAVHIICEERSLWLLAFNDLGRDQKLGLPSWVPDWTSNGCFCPQPYEYQLFASSKDRPYHAKLEDDMQLGIRSIRVDRVTETSSMRTVSWKHPRDLVSQIKEWRRTAGLQDQPVTQDALEDREETFWRAVFADTIGEYEDENSKDVNRRFQNRDLAKVLRWWEWLQTQAKTSLSPEWSSLRTRFHEEGFHTITNMFWHSTETRKLIFTSAGRMGTGPAAFGFLEFADVAVGDQIHVAFGSNLPIILRPLQRGGTIALIKAYKFIGTCYLHGIMDGEVLADKTLEGENILLY
ncbi:hypothetical protein H2199_005442 [Coniosporium tulheliwenetii]|uniref:Uncharacterized protein n=1 Tax=Coniosporium tulheliwenetii TaxID=3383036 RepID=A0ACC2Z1R5_9PEZI|nr:hypothetical protein H2199_005442 [Cladosporium sp. JES 115]